MPVERVRAHPLVQADAGRVALMRGPLVYCIESVDNDAPVQALALAVDSALSAEYRKDLLGGVAVIRGRARVELGPQNGSLYFPMDRGGPAKQTTLTAVPYFANANRGPVDMLVWVREAGAVAGR